MMDRKERVLREARKLGIVDADPCSLESLELAVRLVKKCAPVAAKRFKERLKQQKKR